MRDSLNNQSLRGLVRGNIGNNVQNMTSNNNFSKGERDSNRTHDNYRSFSLDHSEANNMLPSSREKTHNTHVFIARGARCAGASCVVHRESADFQKKIYSVTL